MLSFIRNKIINKYMDKKMNKIAKNYITALDDLEKYQISFKEIEEEVHQLQSNIELIKSVHEKDINAIEQEYETNMNDIFSGKKLNQEEMQSLNGRERLKYSVQKQKEAFDEIDKKYNLDRKELEANMKKNLKIQKDSLNEAVSRKDEVEENIKKGESTRDTLENKYVKTGESMENIDEIMNKFQNKQTEAINTFGKHKEGFLKQLKEKKEKISGIIKSKTAAIKAKANEFKDKSKEKLDTVKNKTNEILYGKEEYLVGGENAESFVIANEGGVLKKGYMRVESYDMDKGGVSKNTYDMKKGVVNMDVYSHEGAQIDISPENVLKVNNIDSGGYGRLSKDKNGYIHGNVLDIDANSEYLKISQISEDTVLVTTTLTIGGKTVEIQKEKSVSDAMKMYNQATALKESVKEKEKTNEKTGAFERT